MKPRVKAMCGGDCSFINPTFKCLFDVFNPGGPQCNCVPPAAMCMDNGGICSGLCPNAGQTCVRPVPFGACICQ